MDWDDKAPKYKQLKGEIMGWIRTGQLKPHQKLPSEHQLIARYKISRHTVRQALDQLTQEGWLYKEQGKGTFANVYPAEQALKQIAVVTTYISDYIFPFIIRGMEEHLREQGYGLLLYSTNNDLEKEKECLEAILKLKPAGVIVEPTKSALVNPNLPLYEQLKQQKIPLIMINSFYESLPTEALLLDDYQVGYQAATYLLELGHQHLLGLFKGDDLQGIRRREGFLQALAEQPQPLPSIHIGEFATENRDEYPGRWVKDKIMNSRPRPTAIVCYNDQISMQVVQSIRELKLEIPEDISIIGCDNSPLATTSEVKLTTFTHPKNEMGTMAARLIIYQIEKGRNHSSSVPLINSLSEREKQEALQGLTGVVIENQEGIDKIIFYPKLLIRQSTTALHE